MRCVIWLCLASAALAGCASSAGTGTSLSGDSKLAQKIALIADTKKRIKTAPCKDIDEAMAYSYLLQRATVDKELIGTPNDKAKGVSLIYRSYVKDFRKEYAGRCKGTPLKTVAVRKLYPDIMRETKQKFKARKGASATEQASR